MIVTAILAIHNEEASLANCLRHCVRNGVNFVIIDHGSSDSSADIYRRHEFSSSLVDVIELQYDGVFSLREQLQSKMAVISAIDTDWVIHLDADEVMHSYRDSESLNEALSRLDAEGWNAVNFDEFVFLPIDRDYVPEAAGHQPLALYYFFQPHSPRLMRAWRKASGFSVLEHGGHSLVGADLRVAPEHLALRHYMVRSQEHAFVKYTTRQFAEDELARGWHQQRAHQTRSSFLFPPAWMLKKMSCVDHHDLDRSAPWSAHFWQLGGETSA